MNFREGTPSGVIPERSDEEPLLLVTISAGTLLCMADQYALQAECVRCGHHFPCDITEAQAYSADAPVDPKCPNCGGDGYIPAAVDALRFVQALTGAQRAALAELVEKATPGTFANEVRTRLPEVAVQMDRMLKHPMTMVFVRWALLRSAR